MKISFLFFYYSFLLAALQPDCTECRPRGWWLWWKFQSWKCQCSRFLLLNIAKDKERQKHWHGPGQDKQLSALSSGSSCKDTRVAWGNNHCAVHNDILNLCGLNNSQQSEQSFCCWFNKYFGLVHLLYQNEYTTVDKFGVIKIFWKKSLAH